MEIQINSAKGTDFAEIEIPFNKGNNIKELQAGIYDLLGNKVRLLKKKDIVRSHAFSRGQFHSDDMVLSFKLIHNRYPYIIKYSYTEEVNEYLYVAYWIPRWFEKVPVIESVLNVEIPEDLKVKVYQQGVDSAKVTAVNGGDKYTWVAKSADYVKRQSYGPTKRELQSKVVVIPEKFKYGIKGSHESWQSFGIWLNDLKTNLHDLPEEEKLKIRALTKDCSDDIEKAKVLYHYMQDNTRYINVALDIGGLQPESAQHVCSTKYGDCKGLCNYLQAMLKEVGVESIYTLVQAGANTDKVRTDYPSQQFNHIILCVPQVNDTIWLECTDNTAPFNYLGTFTQNRQVLLINGSKSRLTKTPALEKEQVLNDFVTHVNVADDGSVNMHTNGIVRGSLFGYLKGLDDALPEREKIDYLDDLELFNHCDIIKYEINRSHRDSAWLELKLHANLNQAAEKIGSRLLLKPIRPVSIKLDKPEKRTQELRFNYPINVKDTIVYHLPKKIESVSGLKTLEWQSEYGYYKKELSIDGHDLKIFRHIVIEAGHYPVEDYEKVYNFIDKCSKAESQKGIVKYQNQH
ncbi:MAG: DUF3857 and transglutaminase domain-containing protein [Carboxylicivirga sp.]|nr:DUF3857 and transglutaminase domain-containing protein [Carboxylicivirga sp.]